MLVYAASLGVAALFVDSLTNPLFPLATVPLVVIYALEKRGQLHWFSGMSLPVLLFAASLHTWTWAIHKVPANPDWVMRLSVGLLVASLCYLMLRMTTYDRQSSSS